MRNGMFTDYIGNVFYYKNNKLHREDGPACVFSDGEERWVIDGVALSDREVSMYKIKTFLE